MKKYLILLLLFTACSPEDHLNSMVKQARSRYYGTVCDQDKNGKYCVIAYSPEYPQVMFDFDDCIQQAKTLEKSRKHVRLNWCQCMVHYGFGADLGVALNKCGTGWFFKVIEESKL